jgi:predicted RNA methylase
MMEWITYWGQKLSQDLLTVQIAIVYIDRIIDQLNDAIHDKYLWGVTSLLLASKYMEVDDKLIKIKNLKNVSVRASFSREKIIKWEQQLMGMIKYELIAKPPIFYFYAMGHEEWDREFLEVLKEYCDAVLKITDIQCYSYLTQFLSALIKASQMTNNYFWDVRKLVNLFDWSFNDVQKWLCELNEININDFKKYTPKDCSIHNKNGTSKYRAHSLKHLADEK